jgi:hypothetical protein
MFAIAQNRMKVGAMLAQRTSLTSLCDSSAGGLGIDPPARSAAPAVFLQSLGDASRHSRASRPVNAVRLLPYRPRSVVVRTYPGRKIEW